MTLSVVDGLGQLVTARHHPKDMEGVTVIPSMEGDEDVNILINVERDGPQIGLIADNKIIKVLNAQNTLLRFLFKFL